MLTQFLEGYELDRKLCEGPVYSLFHGYNAITGQEIRMKLLHPQFAKDEAFVRRAQQEFQCHTTLKHPALATFMACAPDQSQEKFFVSPFIQGLNLREFLHQAGPLFPEISMMVIIALCALVQKIHEQNLTHKRLQPTNILLANNAELVITDIGLAYPPEMSGGLARPEHIHYLAPEQLRDAPLDQRCDIYALGALGFFLLTGQDPFPKMEPKKLVRFILHEKYAIDPRDLNPEIPEPIAEIIRRMAHPQKEKRYQNLPDLTADLLRAISLLSIQDYKAELQAFFASPKAYTVQLQERLKDRLFEIGADFYLEGANTDSRICLKRLSQLDHNDSRIKALYRNTRKKKKLFSIMISLGIFCSIVLVTMIIVLIFRSAKKSEVIKDRPGLSTQVWPGASAQLESNLASGYQLLLDETAPVSFPLAGPLPLQPGRHRVQIFQGPREVFEAELMIQPGEKLHLREKLENRGNFEIVRQ
jgi:serine/threonine protein kinase